MNAISSITPAPTPARADELRILTLHTERAIKALQEHVWLYQRDPAYAQLVLADALSFVLPDVDYTDAMAVCRHELRIDEDGFNLRSDGYPNYERDLAWVPLKALGK